MERVIEIGPVLRKTLSRILLYMVTLIFGFAFMLPFLFALSSSFKTHAEIHLFPPRPLPSVFQWHNYPEVFVQVPFARFIMNSLLVISLGGVGQVVSSAVVAYGFARFRFPGRDILFSIVLSTMMLPWVVTIIPKYIMFSHLGWLDTLYPLIVPLWFGGGAFNIFLFRQFFMTLPLALDEAARIDGATKFKIFWSIIMPLSMPAIATVAIFSFLNNWSAFFTPLIYLNSEKNFTVALGLRLFQRTASLGGRPVDQLLMAASIIAAAPPIIIFFLAQKYFVQGVVMTGMKGGA